MRESCSRELCLRLDLPFQEYLRDVLEGQNQCGIGIEEKAYPLLIFLALLTGEASIIIILVESDAMHVLLRKI